MFYDYHKIITEKLKELFGETLFFPERKANWLFTLLNNIHPKLINLYQQFLFFFIWQKIKKEENDDLMIHLSLNPDILFDLGQKKTHQFLVGFAAETNDVIAHGRNKVERKNLDMLIDRLKTDENYLKRLSENAKKFGKPNAADDICKIILKRDDLK